MNHASLVETYPRQSRNGTHLRPAWRVALWLRARQAAVAILLAYLAFGVAIPWLLLEAPSLPYAIAGTLSPL